MSFLRFFGGCVAWALAMTLLASLRAYAVDLPDLVARITPSIVGVGAAYPPRVPTGGRAPQRLLGSGFVVSVNGRSLVVTNQHVIPDDLQVAGQEQIAVFSGQGKGAERRFARLVASDLEHDLAVLDYAGERLPALVLAPPGGVRAGLRVAFTGFPIGGVLGLFPATHEGIVSVVTPIARAADQGRDLSSAEVRRLRSPFDVYQLDAIAYPGNSGSAVYDTTNGEVIGVMNAVFVKESRESLLSSPSGIAYAIPVVHLHKLLATIP